MWPCWPCKMNTETRTSEIAELAQDAAPNCSVSSLAWAILSSSCFRAYRHCRRAWLCCPRTWTHPYSQTLRLPWWRMWQGDPSLRCRRGIDAGSLVRRRRWPVWLQRLSLRPTHYGPQTGFPVALISEHLRRDVRGRPAGGTAAVSPER